MNEMRGRLIKFWSFIRKNGATILTVGFLLLLLLSPDAKAWVLQQVLRTGLFNASIERKAAEEKVNATTDFEFSGADNNIRSTSELRGKVLFINFWASWCPPCRAEFPSVEAFYQSVKDNPDVFFLTINEDVDNARASDFLKKGNYTIPLYKVRSIVPENLYNGTLPTSIVLDKQGNIRYRHEGFANYSSATFLQQIESLTRE
jgi:thiol-disulfide isomerase/thioredoxin